MITDFSGMKNPSEKKFVFQLSTEEFEMLLDKIIEKKLSQFQGNKTPAINAASEELLKIAAVADYFKVTKKTIHNWVNAGEIKRHYKGGRSYYKKSEIEKSLDHKNKQHNFKNHKH